ncbi:MAG: hypothetical protein OER96_00620 [Gammaproteobacteria bacterium]|nr:hypothetical protein [Gammaproteobacteria bacterium]
MNPIPQHEKAVGFLVKRVAQYLALEIDEEKHGFVSDGLDWEVNAKGVVADGIGFVMFDCKRRTHLFNQSEVCCRIAYQLLQSSPTATMQAIPMRAQARDRLPHLRGPSIEIQLHPDSESTPYEQIADLVHQVADISPGNSAQITIS